MKQREALEGRAGLCSRHCSKGASTLRNSGSSSVAKAVWIGSLPKRTFHNDSLPGLQRTGPFNQGLIDTCGCAMGG